MLSNAYARFKTACLKDGLRDGQFKFNLLMQDEKRQKKFSLIERLAEGYNNWTDRIMEQANEMDDRMRERQKARAQRRKARETKREARREKQK